VELSALYPTPPKSREATPCWITKNAYLIFSQLPSTSWRPSALFPHHLWTCHTMMRRTHITQHIIISPQVFTFVPSVLKKNEKWSNKPTIFCKSTTVYPTETNYRQHWTHLYLYSLYALMKDISLGETVHSNTMHTMRTVSLCNHTRTYCHILHEWYCVVVTQSAGDGMIGQTHKWEGGGRKDRNVQKG